MPLDEEPLHRPDRQRPVDVAAAAGALARGRADVRAHRRDRVRLARQDVALLEPALGGEVEVAAAVRPDRAGFLALDVALEPGGVDGLDEEFLRRGRWSSSGRAFPLGLRARASVKIGGGVDRSESTIRHAGRARRHRACERRPVELTVVVARSYAGPRGAPRRGRPWSWTCAQREHQRVRLSGARPGPGRRHRRRPRRGRSEPALPHPVRSA